MKTSVADEIRLGSDIAGVKKTTSRKKWSAIVKAAHKQGYTVSGALSDAPNALKERTKSSLAKEAAKTVNAAYKPQEQEASRQQQRLDAIAAKRRTDDQTYRDWMTNQTDALTAQAQAADQSLNGLSQTAAAATKAGWQDMKEAALAHAQGLAGNVSDPAQSSALNQHFDAAAASSAGQVDAAAAKGATTAAGNVGSSEWLKAAVLANAAGNRAKIESETNSSQEKLTEATAALKSAKTGDLSKAISALLTDEETKANSNRDYAAAAQQLGLKTQQFDLDVLKEKHSYGIQAAKVNLEQYKADNAKSYNDAKIQVDYDKLKASNGKAAADRALKKWIAQHGKKSTTTTSATAVKNSQTNYRSAQTILGQLKDLHTQFPKGKTDKGRQFRQVLRSRGYDDVMIDVAEDLRKHGGKLSPAGAAKAKALGIARFYGTV